MYRRTCSVCRKEKPLTREFWHHGSVRNGGFTHTCIPCANARSRSRYHNKVKGSEEQQRRLAQTVARNRSVKAALVEERGGRCEACGGEFHPVCFDFHHPKHDRRGDLAPSKFVTYGIERAREATNGLQMLCSNCHRLVHWGENKDSRESVEEGSSPC